MAERADPQDPDFQDRWLFKLKWGLLPYFKLSRNPYRAAHLWRYSWVSKFCQDKDVLDVPCGMGWGTASIRRAKSLTGVDINGEAISEAVRRYGHAAEFRVGSMGKLGYPDASFDVISCLEGIEHVPCGIGEQFLREAHRVLRSDGLLLLSSPYCRTMAHSGNPYHIHEYQPDEIRALVSKYFIIEDVVTREVDIMTVLYMRCRRRDI